MGMGGCGKMGGMGMMNGGMGKGVIGGPAMMNGHGMSKDKAVGRI